MKEREEHELILKLIEKYNVSSDTVLIHSIDEKAEERGHLETPDAGPNNEQKNPSDCSLKKITEDSPQSSLPIANENIDESAVILECKIENMANQCFIINKNRKRVYAGSGKLKILDGKIYRIVYNRSAISINHIEWDEKREKFRLGEKIVYEQKDSTLYKSLDKARYLEQIKAITYEQVSGEYKVEVDKSFNDCNDERTDLGKREIVKSSKPRKEAISKKECSSESQAVLPECDLKIVEMSQKTIVVIGNIKPHMRALKAMGGYAMILKDGKPALVFSSHKKEILQAYINGETSAVHSWEDKRKEKTAVHSWEDQIKEKSQRKRSSRFVIRVEYPNGKVFCSKDVGVALVDVILYAGPQKVRQLRINSLGDNLVSPHLSTNPVCRAVQKRIDNGLYVCVCSSVETIYRQILMIDYGCRLGLKVEKVFLSDFVPDTKKKTQHDASEKWNDSQDDFHENENDSQDDFYEDENDSQDDFYEDENDSQDEIYEKVNDSQDEIFEKVNNPEDEIFEEVNDPEDEIYEEAISQEGKIGDTIRLLPSQRKCEIIGTRIDHEGYERLVIRTEDYHLIEIDNNPYLYVVLKQK